MRIKLAVSFCGAFERCEFLYRGYVSGALFPPEFHGKSKSYDPLLLSLRCLPLSQPPLPPPLQPPTKPYENDPPPPPRLVFRDTGSDLSDFANFRKQGSLPIGDKPYVESKSRTFLLFRPDGIVIRAATGKSAYIPLKEMTCL